MKDTEYVLLLTGTVNPCTQVPFLSLKDGFVRKKQYYDAIKFYIEECKVKKIVFCENSCEKCPVEITDLALENGVEFEWLSFIGDVEGSVKIDKSYGEVEIINYALDHSKLIKACSYFVKATGRVKVRNYKKIIAMLSTKRNYFSAYGDNKLDRLDTRFFSMKVEVYKNFFYNVYDKNIPVKIKSIENLYPFVIRDNNIPIVSFPLKVCFDGISGGFGFPYVTTKKEEILGSLKQLFFTMCGHRLYLQRTCYWQGDMIVTKAIWNTCFEELTGKRIVMCGAGRLGCCLVKTAKEMSKLVAWTDTNYEKIKSIYGRKVEPLDKVMNRKTDFFLICVKDKKCYEDIKAKIIGFTGNDSNIRWIMDLMSKLDGLLRAE
ncbi:MAG: hypothetical protein K5917_00735 [Clostridiales bacterium]|nr:hypothetical protein [Clostridiales bacterium]